MKGASPGSTRDSEADVISFVKPVDKTRKEYYTNKTDMLKDAVSSESSQDEEAQRAQLICPRATLRSQIQ